MKRKEVTLIFSCKENGVVKKTDKGKNSRKGQMKKGKPDPLFGEENSFFQIVELAPDAFFWGDTQDNFLYVNQSAISLTGYSGEELLKLGMHDLFPEEVLVKKPLRFDLLKEGRAIKTERSLQTRSGELIPIEMHSRIMPDGTYQSFVRDITDRKQTELALRKSEEKFRTLVDQGSDAMLLSDLNGHIIDVNRQACQNLGYTREELLERNLTDLDPEFEEMDHVNTIWEKLIPGQTKTIESAHRCKDGSTFPVEINARKIEMDGEKVILGVVRDLTDCKQAEEKLYQAQKMDSIGNLAGGVAHDFNNMLGGIMGYASLLLMKETDPQKKNSVEAIIRAAERASELTQKLLAFGRKGKHLVQAVTLNETVDEIYGLLKRSVDKRIEFEADLDGNLFTVDADPAQMHQVVMNLCVNASHAMAEGGILTTSTRNVILDGTTGYKWTDLAPGDYVEMIVTDTGIGMEEEVRRRAFDPFFSTKEDGAVKGTGLGLATVYGIVKNHGGAVEIRSEVGMGTSVRVLLPRGKKPMVTKAADTETTEPGRGRILVVDDEEIVREMAKDMLESLGYEVLTAQDGLEGVRLYEEQHKEINGVLLDLKMPKMDGKEAFVRMKQIDPDIRALLSTGYGLNEEVQSILDEGAVDLVAKPYRLQELSDSIKKLLR